MRRWLLFMMMLLATLYTDAQDAPDSNQATLRRIYGNLQTVIQNPYVANAVDMTREAESLLLNADELSAEERAQLKVTFAELYVKEGVIPEAARLFDSLKDDTFSDPAMQSRAATLSSYVAMHHFTRHEFEKAIGAFEYALNHAGNQDETWLLMNHIFQIHALCSIHDRRAVSRLSRLFALLREMQANTMRGNGIVEYADVMRRSMTDIILPVMSTVHKTFPDEETTSLCFNIMVYLKTFAFEQVNNQHNDIKHALVQDYNNKVVDALKENEVAIEFAPFEDVDALDDGRKYVAYILDGNNPIQCVEVCSKNEVQRLFDDNPFPWNLYEDGGNRLRQLLWSKVEPYTRQKEKVYLNPCGILNRVNFALFDPRVIELSSSLEIGKRYAVNNNNLALLIGDIDYDKMELDSIRGIKVLGNLRGTKKEIRDVGKCLSAAYQVKTLTRGKATEQEVHQQFKASPKILHFATHGFCYTDSIERSEIPYFNDYGLSLAIKREMTFMGLVLSGGNLALMGQQNQRWHPEARDIIEQIELTKADLGKDGILLAEEIAKLKLGGTSLVVLSACDSGIGVFDDIEGTLGQVQAFKLAGARSVLVSLSEVNDDAACEFMTTFYSRLAQGSGSHSAFVQTVADMRAKYPSQPKYWSVFKMIDGW